MKCDPVVPSSTTDSQNYYAADILVSRACNLLASHCRSYLMGLVVDLHASEAAIQRYGKRVRLPLIVTTP